MTLPAVLGVTVCNVSDVTAEGAVLEASLEPNETTKYFFEYGTAGGYGAKTEGGVTGAGKATPRQPVSGLEPNTTYNCRLNATDEEGTTYGAPAAFKTSLALPAVNEQAASVYRVTSMTALLVGTVNPENSPTTYYFEYGPTASYGARTAERSVGSGLGPQAVESPQISGLLPSTIYHFALVAYNEAEGLTVGEDHTFSTPPLAPPTVGSGQVSEVTPTSAMIMETINTDGLEASYELDLGATDATGKVEYDGTGFFGQVAPGYETVAVQFEESCARRDL